MVSKLAREHVTVALSGDGGDELFAGYTRYVVDRQRSGFARLPRVLRQGVMQPLSRNLPYGARGRNYLHNVALDPLDRYLDSISTFTSLTRPALYSSDFQSHVSDSDATLASYRALASHVKTGDSVDPLLYLDSKTYLPGDILTKVDRMSMAVSLEARVPLLDHKLIDFVTSIPGEMKLKGLTTKHIFKKAVRGLVPDSILDRPKQGFGVPIPKWINMQLRDRIRETLTDTRARHRGYFEPQYIKLMLDEHERGRRDHSAQLWSLFMLELWQRQFVDVDILREPPAIPVSASVQHVPGA
jgi:asparagine synthase (glutamine-hydrolysing)